MPNYHYVCLHAFFYPRLVVTVVIFKSILTVSPLPFCHSATTTWNTFLHPRLYPSVTSIWPADKDPLVLHSCCRPGPAALLRALAHGFLLKSRSEATVLTMTLVW